MIIRIIDQYRIWSWICIKSVECLITNQPKSYLNNNNLDENLYSAFRSADPDLLTVISDSRCSSDKSQGILLFFLGIRAAFNTVDYWILFDRFSMQD